LERRYITHDVIRSSVEKALAEALAEILSCTEKLVNLGIFELYNRILAETAPKFLCRANHFVAIHS